MTTPAEKDRLLTSGDGSEVRGGDEPEWGEECATCGVKRRIEGRLHCSDDCETADPLSNPPPAGDHECRVSYHHEAHDACPGRDETTCMEPTCYATATTGFVGRKVHADDLTYRTCASHKMRLAFGLIRFGLIESADFVAMQS